METCLFGGTNAPSLIKRQHLSGGDGGGQDGGGEGGGGDGNGNRGWVGDMNNDDDHPTHSLINFDSGSHSSL